jgi:tRNA(adenine34) deaminase
LNGNNAFWGCKATTDWSLQPWGRINTLNEEDCRWLQYALTLAQRAAAEGEVPVGAVLVYQNEVLGEGYNRSIAACDPTAHAEILALRQAATQIGNYRLVNSVLYVTLEPCPMCAGAIVNARVERVVFGARDPRAGACGTVFNILQADSLNHRVIVEGGLLAETCGELLQSFFRARRGRRNDPCVMLDH